MPNAPTVMSSLDTETIPDFDLISKITDIDKEDHVAIVKWLEEGKEYNQTFKPIYNQIVECSIAFYADGKFGIDSLANPELSTDESEEEILELFTDIVNGSDPNHRVFTWNGEGFDFPVMRMRAMKYGTSLQNYWNTEDTRKWNGYFNRYQTLHTDLMDILAGYYVGRNASLNDTAIMCGLPGKIGAGGDKVLSMYLKGDLESIRQYCEIDALLTFLLGLRFLKTQGIPKRHYLERLEAVLDYLDDSDNQESNEYFSIFLNHWDQTTW